jgi:hypothetical protein
MIFSEHPDPSRGTRILSSFSIETLLSPLQCKINNSYSVCQTKACRIAPKVKKKKSFQFKGFPFNLVRRLVFKKTKPHGQSLWPSAKADKGRADIGVSFDGRGVRSSRRV